MDQRISDDDVVITPYSARRCLFIACVISFGLWVGIFYAAGELYTLGAAAVAAVLGWINR